MKIVESFASKNKRYIKSTAFKPEGLMIHSVGTNQPNARIVLKEFDNEDSKSSIHAVIDANDGTIYQIFPYTYKAYHCGGGANSTHVGIEMCEPPNIEYTSGQSFICLDIGSARKYVERTYNVAVEYSAFLCDKFKFDPLKDGIIISHKEGNARGLASISADPEHLWSQLGMPYSMDTFRKDVFKALSNGESSLTESNLYRINFNNLNIRTGPSVYYPATGKVTGEGTFRIVEIQNGIGSINGWGLLDSYSKKRDGWICLDYAEKM